MRRLLGLAFAAALSVATGGCGDAGSRDEVTVFAAASLTDAFEEVAAAFESDHPDTNVRFNFGGSSSLAVQVTQGAPADVFASANEEQMGLLVEEGLVMEPERFATNSLAFVTTPGSDVTSLSDLARPGVRVVLAASDVPAGAFARQMLENAEAQERWGDDFADQVLGNVVSNETDVRAALTKVQLGEADAGIVYETDVRAAGDAVEAVEVPEEVNVTASYPIAVLENAEHPDAARAFVDFVLSDAGQAILAEHGFGRP